MEDGEAMMGGGGVGLTPTILCVVEEVKGKGKNKGKEVGKEGEGEGGGGGEEKVRIGLVAVMPSTGEVVYDGACSSLSLFFSVLVRLLTSEAYDCVR